MDQGVDTQPDISQTLLRHKSNSWLTTRKRDSAKKPVRTSTRVCRPSVQDWQPDWLAGDMLTILIGWESHEGIHALPRIHSKVLLSAFMVLNIFHEITDRKVKQACNNTEF